MVSPRRWSVKDRGWCPRLGGQSRTGGGVPEEVVSQGQGVVSQIRWSVKDRGGVPEEVVSQGQGVVSQIRWSVKDRGWCPRGGGQSRTGGGVPD